MCQSVSLAVLYEGEALKAQLTALLEGIFKNPDTISLAFTDDYEQTTDGKLLNRSEFEAHVRHVTASVRTLRFTVLEAVRQGDSLADRHVVEVTYADGTKAALAVYLFAQLRDGRLARTHELTRVISGDKDAQAIASAPA